MDDVEKFRKRQEDQFDYPKRVNFVPKEEVRERPRNPGISGRVAGILKEGITKQAIDPKCGYTDRVTPIEASLLRQLFRREKVEELVERLTDVEPKVLDKVLSGLYWPYSGDLLKPRSRQGPLPTGQGIKREVRLFSRCVVEIAVETLDEDDIDIFCRMLGVEGAKISAAVSSVESRSDEDVKQYLTVSYRTQVNRDFRSRSRRLHGTD